MKIRIFSVVIMIVLSLQLPLPMAFGGAEQEGGTSSIGRGGDFNAIEFKQVGYVILNDCRSSGITQIDNVDLFSLESALDRAIIITTKKELYLNGLQKNAINYSKENKIILNSQAWTEATPEIKKQIVIHELLGLIGIDDIDYKLSHAIVLRVSPTRAPDQTAGVFKKGPCGLEGPTLIRMTDCSTSLQTRSGHIWALVARNNSHEEIWRDEMTGLLWSDISHHTIPYHQIKTICHPASGQEEIQWNIPSTDDYDLAMIHGYREIFSDEGLVFWTSSVTLGDEWPLLYQGWSNHNVQQNAGLVEYSMSLNHSSENKHHFRCVGANSP